ncbi:MAG: lipid-A-disaccharide synthase [bacterium]
MSDQKRIMIIAGEASGDLHASSLVLEIRKLLPNVCFTGIGGSRMREIGVDLILDNREIAVTGFSEVFSKIRTILRAFRLVKETILRVRPDLLILLDFPDFNLRVAKTARRMGIPVLYYISPQVWAWRRGRVRAIQGLVEKIMVILPFEASLYGDKGVFVGNPLLDVVRPSLTADEAREQFGIRKESPVVALLPGSRENEIRQLLPLFLKAAHLIREQVPDIQYLLPVAPTVSDDEVEPMIQKAGIPIRLVRDRAYDAIALSDFAVVASGTATLETAILGVPMMIVYKMSRMSYFMASRLVRVPHIGLINMVAGERIVPELVQDQLTPERIMEEALHVLKDRARAEEISGKLKQAVSRLGGPGASARAAGIVVQFLEVNG